MSKIDDYLDGVKQRKEEMSALHDICKTKGMEEVLKWGKPCYMAHGENIIVIQGFKSYVALLFVKGQLIDDPESYLVPVGENTEIAMQMRFNTVEDILKMKAIISDYLDKAIQVAKLGLKPEKKETKVIEMPLELSQFFQENSDVEKAFLALTPGRQRSYLLHFASAKQSATKLSRIEKAVPNIMLGKGFNER